MEVLKEITQWDNGLDINHTYLISGDKLVAYKPRHGSEVRLSTCKFDRARRKFEKFPFIQEEWPGVEVYKDPSLVEVQGSKGAVYTVNTAKGTCSCTGYKFRGHCKHVEELC